MKVLELSGNEGIKEYLNIDEISHWYPHITVQVTSVDVKSSKKTWFGFGQAREITKRVYAETPSVKGSWVFMKSGKKTYVNQTCSEILAKLQNNIFIDLPLPAVSIDGSSK